MCFLLDFGFRGSFCRDNTKYSLLFHFNSTLVKFPREFYCQYHENSAIYERTLSTILKQGNPFHFLMHGFFITKTSLINNLKNTLE